MLTKNYKVLLGILIILITMSITPSNSPGRRNLLLLGANAPVTMAGTPGLTYPVSTSASRTSGIHTSPSTSQVNMGVGANPTISIDLAEYTRLLTIAANQPQVNVSTAQQNVGAAQQNVTLGQQNIVTQPLPSAWTPKLQMPSFDGNPVGPGPKDFLTRAEQLQVGKGIPQVIFLQH